MFQNRRHFAFGLMILAVLVAPASARQGSGSNTNASPPPESHSPYRSQVFEVKHRAPSSLLEPLEPLRSGAGGTSATASDDFGTISVRDYPENLATIGEAIKRLDVAQAAHTDIEIHLHALLASATGPSDELPSEIKSAVAQLESTLNFKSFTLLAPIVQRASEGGGGGRSGAAGVGEVSHQNPNYDVNYEYSINRIARRVEADGTSRVDLNRFQFLIKGSLGVANVASDVSLREGEQVVVGTAMLGSGRALVIILSVRSTK